MKTIKLIFAVVTLLLSTSAYSDFFTPSHSCIKPFVPIEFSSQTEIDIFMLDVEMYERCIKDFIDDQNREIKNHIEAINDATD